MTGDTRRQQLSEFLACRGYAELGVLVAELGVSESTIRRDLSQLEQEGTIRRTHGGAVFTADRLGATNFDALNYDARSATAVAEKQAIGQAAAALVQDGETVLLDGGTTTVEVARQLLHRSLQVVTNSLPIAHLMNSAPHIELVFIGGYIFPRTGVAVGPLSVQALGALHANKVFMGVAGIDEGALYNANLLLVESELRMMACADEVIVVADRSKFGRRGLARLSDWAPINKVITDEGLDAKWREVVPAAGAELVLARTRSENSEPRTENRELRTEN